MYVKTEPKGLFTPFFLAVASRSCYCKLPTLLLPAAGSCCRLPSRLVLLLAATLVAATDIASSCNWRLLPYYDAC